MKLPYLLLILLIYLHRKRNEHASSYIPAGDCKHDFNFENAMINFRVKSLNIEPIAWVFFYSVSSSV